MGITSDIQKKLYLFYLTTPRIVSLLGMINKDSPTYDILFNYITLEFPQFYEEILQLVCESESQQYFVFRNILYFFGRKGISDILYRLKEIDFSVDAQLKKWDSECKQSGITFIDFELIRIYRRFVEMNALSDTEHELCQNAILRMSMSNLATILQNNIHQFKDKLSAYITKEKGQEYLNRAVKAIVTNIQLRLNGLLEE